jgi:serine/threonine protein kinase
MILVGSIVVQIYELGVRLRDIKKMLDRNDKDAILFVEECIAVSELIQQTMESGKRKKLMYLDVRLQQFRAQIRVGYKKVKEYQKFSLTKRLSSASFANGYFVDAKKKLKDGREKFEAALLIDNVLQINDKVDRIFEMLQNEAASVVKVGTKESLRQMIESDYIRCIPSNFLNFSSEDTIFKGSYGDVIRGRYRDEVVVVKKFVGGTNPEEFIRLLSDAVDTLYSVQCNFLIKIFGIDPSAGVIVLESASCDVEMLLSKGGKIDCLSCAVRSLENVRYICVALASALKVIHGCGFIHRSICPKNILLFPVAGSEKWVPKLSDFGVSVSSGFPFIADSIISDEYVPYAAPELLAAPSQFTQASDIYAFGITVNEMAAAVNSFSNGGAAVKPWSGFSRAEVIALVVQEKRRPTPFSSSGSNEIAFLLRKIIGSKDGGCLSQSVAKRMTVSEVIAKLQVLDELEGDSLDDAELDNEKISDLLIKAIDERDITGFGEVFILFFAFVHLFNIICRL